ncbi:hypothetical protein MYMA111404_02270 [Mycoplasma marinum]|uniref:Uncharacterized protein n=1 Tax=Mycoplasma marinum TaxID=1937190 RepID=A0A4R0XSC8_9MOLU|nr:hypothetical protein C4B24_02145 [Mycoplasma marinum]
MLKRAKIIFKREVERNLLKGKYITQKANDIYSKRFITKHKLPIENYLEFSKLFLKYFDKKWCSIEITWTRIKIEKTDISTPPLK